MPNVIENRESLLNKVVLANQSIGVVRYIGPLQDFKDNSEPWYGIEWKDSSRGKHDGSFNGNRYFQTKHPTGGSFVKESKIEPGVEVWEVVKEKYFSENDFESEQEMTKSKDDQNKLLYNNFDFDLNSRNIKLDTISVAQSKVAHLTTLDKIKETFPDLKEIDLEENLFCSWEQIFQVLDELKRLYLINVSNNMLTFPSEASEHKTYQNITTLVLNKLGYNWKDVNLILKHFPAVAELKLCFNQITEIDFLQSSLVGNLKILDLESNPIVDWKHLKKIGELKELETLFANDIQLAHIHFDDCEPNAKTSLFPKLKSLAINDNQINDWPSINELNKLRSLTELRMKSNPLNKNEKPENVRQLVIAKLSDLKMFNRTPIENDERKGAEIDYLKRFGKEWLELKCTPNKIKLDIFVNEHPNYAKISAKYGEVEKGEAETKPDTLKSKLLTVYVLNESTNERIQRKIPYTIEIKRLKVLACNLFKSSGLDLDSIRLFYKSPQKSDTEYELDNDFRTLNFYSIENEDTIVILKS